MSKVSRDETTRIKVSPKELDKLQTDIYALKKQAKRDYWLVPVIYFVSGILVHVLMHLFFS